MFFFIIFYFFRNNYFILNIKMIVFFFIIFYFFQFFYFLLLDFAAKNLDSLPTRECLSCKPNACTIRSNNQRFHMSGFWQRAYFGARMLRAIDGEATHVCIANQPAEVVRVCAAFDLRSGAFGNRLLHRNSLHRVRVPHPHLSGSLRRR